MADTRNIDDAKAKVDNNPNDTPEADKSTENLTQAQPDMATRKLTYRPQKSLAESLPPWLLLTLTALGLLMLAYAIHQLAGR